jgi:release factor glutamine methyltransferase
MASSFLEQAGYPDPRFEAELFLRYLLELDRAQFFSRLGEDISSSEQDELQGLLERRVSGEPVQYILGGTEFYGRFFFVNPSVLIPRPETEILVENVLQEAGDLWEKPAHIVEVGTGSGIIATTLLLEQSQWRITAIDISQKALDVARENATLYGVEKKITWVHGEYLSTLTDDVCIDILVSNPPYIPSHVVTSLDIEVKDFEPRIALDGGEDGLEPYRQIMEQLKMRNNPPRLICFEIGAEQGMDVTAIIKYAFPGAVVSIYKDLAGRNRVVVGKNLLSQD